jgi:hypothetical protein
MSYVGSESLIPELSSVSPDSSQSYITSDSCRPVCLGIRHPPGIRDKFFPIFSLFFLQFRFCLCGVQVQVGLSIVLYMRSLLFVESFDLRPSKQYILVRMIPSSFRFAKMCLCQSCSPSYFIFSGELHIVYINRGDDDVSFCAVNVTWIDLDPLAFILHFLNQVWIANKLVCSLCEATAGSLSVASTAVSLAKVAVVDSGELGRSTMYSRYNNGARTLPWGTPALTEDSSVYSILTFTRECLVCKYDFRIRK